MQFLKSTAAIALVLGLAACGGGGSTGSVSTPPTSVTSTGPASEAPQDLIAFATDGGTTSVVGNADWRVSRTSRTVTGTDGAPVTVTVDVLPGGDYGMISLRRGENMTFYTMNDGLVANATLPSAYYVGPWSTTYRMPGQASYVLGQGDFSVSVDMAAGTASFGGMSSAATSSVEIYGDTTVAGGSFSSSDARVVLREDGAYIGETLGSVDAILTGAGDNAAAVGTTSALDTTLDFEMNGGFSAPIYLGN